MNYEAFTKLSYGLYIVSSQYNNKLNAFIGNTVFQVSSEPAQIAMCCSKNNYTQKIISDSKIFSISILKEETKMETFSIFGYKSGKNINKFENINYKKSKNGCPIVLEDTIAWLECKVVKEIDLGTHIMYIGKVIDNDILDKTSEVITYNYFKKVKNGIAPKNAPTYINTSKMEKQKKITKKYRCIICGYVYDPEIGDEEHGIKKGTEFNDIPDDWECPICGAGKEDFEEI